MKDQSYGGTSSFRYQWYDNPYRDTLYRDTLAGGGVLLNFIFHDDSLYQWGRIFQPNLL